MALRTGGACQVSFFFLRFDCCLLLEKAWNVHALIRGAVNRILQVFCAMAFTAFAAAAATIPARGGTFGMPAVSAIPTLAELEYILDRAISVQGFGISSSSTAPRFDEALSFLQSAGVRYAGRSVYMWGGESALVSILPTFRDNAKTGERQESNLRPSRCPASTSSSVTCFLQWPRRFLTWCSRVACSRS